MTATPETRLWAGLPREAPQTPWSCLKGLPPASLARGSPGQHPQLHPRPCPQCRALLPTRWSLGQETPLAAAWGCLPARPHGSQSQSPEERCPQGERTHVLILRVATRSLNSSEAPPLAQLSALMEP